MMIKDYYYLKKLEKYVNLGFFKSTGGVSKGDYFSLNCNKNSEDNKINVKKNINIALKKLGLERKKIKLINQIHSKKIFEINNINYKKLIIAGAKYIALSSFIWDNPKLKPEQAISKFK